MKLNLGYVAITLHLLLSLTFAGAEEIALPAIKSVDYDGQGRFRVNGKPFFPILLYGAATDGESLARFRDFGFNVLACRPEVSDALPSQGFYAAVHGGRKPASTVGVLLAIGADSPALNFQKNLLEKVAEENARTAAALPNRPVMNAIGYWEDEPAGVVSGKLPSKEKYEDLIGAIDVAAPYLYPVPYQPVASVGDAVARARRAGGGKPVLPILQLFTWEASARYPTVAELRCMAYLALAEGASGIGYYTYTPVTGHPKTTIAEVQPELWQSVKELNREIAEVAPLLLADAEKSSIVLEDGPVGLKFKAAGRNAGFPIVLVNSRAIAQKGKLAGPTADAKGSFVFEGGRRIDVKEGIATVTLEPFEVVIIRRFEQE